MTTLTQQDWECAVLALLLWREARGETVDTKRVVCWTVKNRVLSPRWWGRDWCSVIYMPEQYSSMTHSGDPNLVKFPIPNDTSWMACMDVASEVYNAPASMDPAKGSTHYFDRSLDEKPPSWAAEMLHVMDSGAFHFYK